MGCIEILVGGMGCWLTGIKIGRLTDKVRCFVGKWHQWGEGRMFYAVGMASVMENCPFISLMFVYYF